MSALGGGQFGSSQYSSTSSGSILAQDATLVHPTRDNVHGDEHVLVITPASDESVEVTGGEEQVGVDVGAAEVTAEVGLQVEDDASVYALQVVGSRAYPAADTSATLHENAPTISGDTPASVKTKIGSPVTAHLTLKVPGGVSTTDAISKNAKVRGRKIRTANALWGGQWSGGF